MIAWTPPVCLPVLRPSLHAFHPFLPSLSACLPCFALPCVPPFMPFTLPFPPRPPLTLPSLAFPSPYLACLVSLPPCRPSLLALLLPSFAFFSPYLACLVSLPPCLPPCPPCPSFALPSSQPSSLPSLPFPSLYPTCFESFLPSLLPCPPYPSSLLPCPSMTLPFPPTWGENEVHSVFVPRAPSGFMRTWGEFHTSPQSDISRSRENKWCEERSGAGKSKCNGRSFKRRRPAGTRAPPCVFPRPLNHSGGKIKEYVEVSVAGHS